MDALLGLSKMRRQPGPFEPPRGSTIHVVCLPKVSKRYLSRKGKDAKGNFIDPSNNADAYSVIE